MTTYKLVWTGPRSALQTLDVLLTEVLFPPADAVTLLKDDAAKTEDEAAWELHAYFTALPTNVALVELTADLDLEAPAQETLPETDWVAHSLEGLGVVEAGDFVLFGSHDAAKVEAHPGLKLQVEANRAFGTGHHPTTAGCLVALTRLKDLAPKKILDVGTGSGILAMAARRLWPDAQIIATDLDAPSIPIAEENASLNGISDIHFAVADGISGPAKDHAPFDLVLANILAEPLMTLAPAICDVLASNGTLVLAGLLERQAAAVQAAYDTQGLSVSSQVEDANWPVLTLNRP